MGQTRLVVVGGGAHSRETIDIIDAVNLLESRYSLVGVVADGRHDGELLRDRGVEYLGGTARLAEIDAEYVIAIGSGGARREIDRLATSWNRTAAILIHPSATLGFGVSLGQGCVVAAGVRITTNVRLGRHVHANINSTISHDCKVADYATLSPGVHLSGRVVVEEGALVGVGASVVPGVVIGVDSVIGAGAAVIEDVVPGDVVAGVPARSIGPGDRRPGSEDKRQA